MDSILTSIKKLLGIEDEYIQFDQDIIMDINTVLLSINQFGIGPETGFVIHDKTETWSSLLGTRLDFEAVKTYIYLKVRLLFDPPANAFVVEAMERQITELEWRLTNQAQPAPDPVTVVQEPTIDW
jgi:hypothetical protein